MQRIPEECSKGKRRTPTKSLLERLYWRENLTSIKIGKQLGYNSHYLTHLMKIYDIPRRPASIKGRSRKQVHTGAGYIVVKEHNHHRGDKQNYVREHILIWEQVHNQLLPDGWIIHHLNGVKDDNRPSNLMALPSKDHHSYLISQTQQKRIRKLEAEITLLKKALNRNQLIFLPSEN